MALSMSASADKGVSRAFTSLHLIGATDINAADTCNGLYLNRCPDLKTEGGAIFKGSVAVLGDMCIGGSITGNVGGNLSGNLMGDISVEGDLDVGGNLTAMDGIISNLETDVLCINDELFVDTISPKTGTFVDAGNLIVEDLIINGMISGNLDVDISNVTSLTLQTLTGNLVDANIVCVNEELQTNLIVPKSGGTIGVSANIVPTANITYDLGTQSNRWGNIYASEILISSIDGLSPITAKTDFLPSDDLQFNLGIFSQRWKTIYVGEIDNSGNLNGNVISGNDGTFSNTVTANVVIGNVILSDQINGTTGNGVIIEGVLALDSSLTANVITANTICTDEIKGATDSDVLLSGNLIPSQDDVFSIGNIDNKVSSIFVQDLTVCGSLMGNVNVDLGNVSNLSVDVLTANSVCTAELKPMMSGEIISLGGNIIPSQDGTFVIGNANAKVGSIFVNDITVCGQILGNVDIGANIDLGNVGNIGADVIEANTVCVNIEIQADVINEKTSDTGVTIDGVVIQDANVTSSVASTDILEVNTLFDYKRTVVNTPSYAILQTDDIIGVRSTANGMVTLTLPLIDSLIRKRKRYVIVDEAGHAGANAIVINTSGSDKIFAGNSWMVAGDFNAFQIYSDENDSWFAV